MTGNSTEWPSRRVDQLCELGRGRVISQEEIRRHVGVYPVYSSQSKDDGIFGFLNTFDFEGQFVTWTTDGANAGTVFFRSGRFNCTNVCGTLKPKSSETNAKFLARLLSTVAKRHVSYVGNPKLMNNVMAAIRLRIPPRSVQDFAVAVLDAIDAAFAKTSAVIAKLKQVRAGLLHDLLTRGLDDHGELRDPRQHPEQFQDSPLGRIPKSWDVRKCGSVCREIVVGIVVTPAKYYVANGVPVLRSANLRDDGIVLDDIVFISTASNVLHRKSIIRAGDVLTVRTGYPGTTCVVPEFLDGANCVDLIISRPRSDVVPHFLALWVNSPFGKDQVLRVQGGLAQQHFNIGEMRNLLVAVPENSEQLAIFERLQAFDELRAREQEALDKLRILKSGLMSDLLTGRVPVPENIATEVAP